MCGRFTLTISPELVAKVLGYTERPNFPPRFNIAPTQPIAVVVSRQGARHFELMRWGFLPSWVKDEKAFPLLINARAETLAEKPAFRNAAKRRRAIVPASGFYEWRKDGKKRVPFHIRRPDGGLLCLAGLHETWIARDGSEIDTAAIITVSANGTVAALHERMPAIIAENDLAAWLDSDETETAQALSRLRPAPEGLLELVEVGPEVNRAGSEGEALLKPVGG